jgi:hypothetical protein
MFILLLGFGFMMFNATFNNISVKSWRSVLLVEEIIKKEDNGNPIDTSIVVPVRDVA